MNRRLSALCVVGVIATLTAWIWASSFVLMRHDRRHHHGGAFVCSEIETKKEGRFCHNGFYADVMTGRGR